MFKTLHTDTIESLVIAYGKSEASGDLLTSLKCLWSVIEEYVNNGKLSSVGVSDVDTDVFIQLFQWAKVSNSALFICWNWLIKTFDFCFRWSPILYKSIWPRAASFHRLCKSSPRRMTYNFWPTVIHAVSKTSIHIFLVIKIFELILFSFHLQGFYLTRA